MLTGLKTRMTKMLGQWLVFPFPHWNNLTFLSLRHFYLLSSPTSSPENQEKGGGAFPSKQCQHSDKRKDEAEGETEREKTERQPETGSMNGPEATWLALTKRGRGTKTRRVNMFFPLVITNCSREQIRHNQLAGKKKTVWFGFFKIKKESQESIHLGHV